MKNIRRSKLYKGMNFYDACAIAEGFCGYEPTQNQLQAAWQYIVDNGLCSQLQGWYGRTAYGLIQEGLILPPSRNFGG